MAPDDPIRGFATGMFEIARAEGELEKVRGELLQVARTFESSTELRERLSDPRLPLDRKQAIIDDLIGGRSSDVTAGLVGFIVAMGKATALPELVDVMAEVSAAAANKEVAEIRTAIALDDDTVQRLVGALARATGKDLEPKVVVDPSVVGGVVARVGDTVIDGSVRSRLRGLRQSLTAR